MKVLFYIEPHPLRDSKVHFHEVAKSFFPILLDNKILEIKIFANRATFDFINVSLEPYEAHLIRTTDEDEDVFERYNSDWLTAGIGYWRDLMSGRSKISEDYEAVLERIWQRFSFDTIIHWGENGAINNFIRDRDIARIGMELGCTRPPFFDSLVMDPYGTNGSGMVPKLSIDELRDAVGNLGMSSEEAILAYAQSADEKLYAKQFKPLPSDLMSRISKAEKLAFFPLQLFDDANLLHFSPYETLSDVVLDTLPKLVAAGYTTIITPHPATGHRRRGIPSTLLAKEAASRWSDQVIWLDTILDRPENTQLITISDVVLTVNSSVGFEALYFDKPVIVLGDAVYKPRDLFPTLDEFLGGSFNYTEYLDGISLLRRFFLGGYLQDSSTRAETLEFENLILLISSLYREHRDDPASFAKYFWLAMSTIRKSRAEQGALFGKSGDVDDISFNGLRIPSVNRVDPSVIKWLPIAHRLLKYSGHTSSVKFKKWLEAKSHSLRGIETIVSVGGIFNNDDYLELYPDVKLGAQTPLFHYIFYGIKEQRAPCRSLPGLTLDDIVSSLSNASVVLLYVGGEDIFNSSLPYNTTNKNNLYSLAVMVLKGRVERLCMTVRMCYFDLRGNLACLVRRFRSKY